MIPRRPLLPPPGPLTLAKLLLVEGETPLHFFEALLRHLALDGDIEVRSFRGYTDFRSYIAALVVTPEFARVVSRGIVRDAEDTPAAAALQSVQDACNAARIGAPGGAAARVSVFILPDNAGPGMIETLCMRAVAAEPDLAAAHRCVQDFFGCLQTSGMALPAEPSLAKHHAQVYLATRLDVQMFPGIAAYRGHWPWTNPVFQPLIRFLQTL